jgi:hypothetical protein
MRQRQGGGLRSVGRLTAPHVARSGGLVIEGLTAQLGQRAGVARALVLGREAAHRQGGIAVSPFGRLPSRKFAPNLEPRRPRPLPAERGSCCRRLIELFLFEHDVLPLGPHHGSAVGADHAQALAGHVACR